MTNLSEFGKICKAIENDNEYDTFSDMYKDVYGHRPRGRMLYAYQQMPQSDQQEWKADLQEQINADLQSDRDAHDEAVISCMKAGAVDVTTAERWLRQAERN
tara:strand:+ start:483 stop:788 length:306 start_codon:yes stop_codon:yes gene_type:complete